MGKTELEKLDFMISHAKADINLCAVAYRILTTVDKSDQARLMEHFIKGFKETSTDGSVDVPVVISDEQKEYLTKRYQRIVDGHLEEFFNARPLLTKDEFYEELTNYIMNDRNLREDGAREFAIFNCCIDKRLPYAAVDLEAGVRMDNEEYKERLDLIGEDILDNIKYILNANLEQKTERASLLLKEIDEITDERQRAVLFSTILNIYENKAIRNARLASRLGSLGSLAEIH